MPRFDSEQLGGESGVDLDDVAKALTVLKTMRGTLPLSVQSAAKLFNTTPDLIRDAVRTTSWLWLAGPDDEAPGNQFIHVAGLDA